MMVEQYWGFKPGNNYFVELYLSKLFTCLNIELLSHKSIIFYNFYTSVSFV
jgi:hypothetical protein